MFWELLELCILKCESDSENKILELREVITDS